MARAHIFALGNNKGGVTKTTSTVQISYGLARRGKKTLVLDVDPQCNTTYTLLGEIPTEEDNADAPIFTLQDVILGTNNDAKQRKNIADVIVSVPQQKNLFLAQGSIGLSSTDLLLAATNGRERILRRAIESIRGDFDYILMDTPPTLGLLPVNAFVAAGSENSQDSGLIIPIAPQVYSVLGIRTLEDALDQMREEIEIPLPIFGVICANARQTKNAANRLDQVLDYFRGKVFPYIIPVNEKVEEAADVQVSLFDYASKSKGAIAYAKLTNTIMHRAGDLSHKEAIDYLKESKLWDKEDEEIWNGTTHETQKPAR